MDFITEGWSMSLKLMLGDIMNAVMFFALLGTGCLLYFLFLVVKEKFFG